jgi:predicted transcriptional regulator
MEVQFNPDLQARLTQRASQQGVKLNEVVQDVVARYFEGEDRFVEAVKRGEAALERDEFLTHDQVGERLRRFLQPCCKSFGPCQSPRTSNASALGSSATIQKPQGVSRRQSTKVVLS